MTTTTMTRDSCHRT